MAPTPVAGEKKCYFGAPRRDCPPEGPIKLGNVVASPLIPDEPINENPAPPIETSIYEHNDRNWTLERVKTGKGSVGIWTSFLAPILGVGADVGTSWDNDCGQEWRCKNLCTRWFIPSQEYVKQAVHDPAVRRFLAGNRFRERIYMITGLMIASGASLAAKSMQERGLYVHAGVDATVLGGAPVSAGPEGELKRGTRERETVEGADDFVFAFRLREIRVKRKGEVVHKQFSKGALYNDEIYVREDRKDDAEVEVLGIDEQDADAEEFGLDDGDVVEDDDGQECVWVKPEE
ncbi:hypothetical protein BDY21DRAFT_369266 [Lineolata rhizophorae]|uniref:Uncharacterized protein n=1 Tax=Lineolata rhizophorae TaxID=578093 RepID=A0A6A6P866_9PEZI|nr:hypothetical protein BDY21DRAFT_369266 [Lineolata rhizophorae]